MVLVHGPTLHVSVPSRTMVTTRRSTQPAAMDLDDSSKTVRSLRTPHAALVSPAAPTNICPSACDVVTVDELVELLDGATLNDAAKRHSSALVALVAQDSPAVAQRLFDRARARARAAADLAASSDS